MNPSFLQCISELRESVCTEKETLWEHDDEDIVLSLPHSLLEARGGFGEKLELWAWLYDELTSSTFLYTRGRGQLWK